MDEQNVKCVYDIVEKRTREIVSLNSFNLWMKFKELIMEKRDEPFSEEMNKEVLNAFLMGLNAGVSTGILDTITRYNEMAASSENES